MKKYFEILQKSPLFAGVGEEELAAVLGCLGARVIPCDKRQTLMAEGSAAREIGIVLRGAVQIVRVDYFGNRSLVAEMGPSEMFGEAFACAGAAAIPVDVVAAEAGEIMLLDCRRVLSPCSHACGFHSQMIFNLMRAMARKNLMFHQKIEILSRRTTREKLMTYLMLEAKRRGSDSFEIPYDRQELADYLEVDRSGLSAEIGKLRREGVLTAEKNRFRLLKTE